VCLCIHRVVQNTKQHPFLIFAGNVYTICILFLILFSTFSSDPIGWQHKSWPCASNVSVTAIPCSLAFFFFFLSLWIYLWLTETSQQPISQTTWLKVTSIETIVTIIIALHMIMKIKYCVMAHWAQCLPFWKVKVINALFVATCRCPPLCSCRVWTG